MNYKTGDKVKVKENFWEIKSDVYDFDKMKKLVGRTLEVEYVYGVDVHTKQDDSNDKTSWSWNKDWIELYRPTITWDTLEWKDVVIDANGEERLVLDVRNDLVDISFSNDFDSFLATRHKKELQMFGYTIKQATPVEEPKETIEVGGNKYKLIKE